MLEQITNLLGLILGVLAVMAPFVFMVLGGVLVIGFFISQLVDFREEQEKMEAAWQALATANGLDLVRVTLFWPRIAGDYRGYHLALKIIHRHKERYTYLTLAKPSQLQSHFSQEEELLEGPLIFEEIDDLLIPYELPHRLSGVIKTEVGGQMVAYEQPELLTNITYLRFLFDLLADLMDVFPRIIALGGQAAPALEEMAKSDHILRAVAAQLLRNIGRDTSDRLSDLSPFLICSNCLVRCAALKAHLALWEQVTYYGCRACGQSRDFLEVSEPLVAVLDEKMALLYTRLNGALRVNWLAHRQPFDFDAVEIVQATDEEVERFAVQVGNDTDPVRRPRYRQMACRIAPGCELSSNTLRILARMFGTVHLDTSPQ